MLEFNLVNCVFAFVVLAWIAIGIRIVIAARRANRRNGLGSTWRLYDDKRGERLTLTLPREPSCSITVRNCTDQPLTIKAPEKVTISGRGSMGCIHCVRHSPIDDELCKSLKCFGDPTQPSFELRGD